MQRGKCGGRNKLAGGWLAKGLSSDPASVTEGSSQPLSTYQLGRYLVAAAASALSSSSRSSSGARAALSTVQPPGSTGGLWGGWGGRDEGAHGSGGRQLRAGG